MAFLAATAHAQGQAPASESLSLAEARSRAVAQSPLLAAALAELTVATAELRQAGLWPNPELGGEVEELDGILSRSAESETRLALQQPLPILVRGARREVARWGREEAEVRLELARRDLDAEVGRRFWSVLAAQERLQLTEMDLQTAREVSATVRELVAAGEVSPIEESRADADAALVASVLSVARRDLLTARGALANALGEARPAFRTVTGELPTGAEVADLATLQARLGDTAEIRLLAVSEGRLAAESTVARREAWPEPAMRLGTFHRGIDREIGYVAGLAIQLPLWDRKQGAVAAARARQEVGRQRRRLEELRLSATLGAAHADLVQATEETRLGLQELLPRAEAVFSAISEGYRRGKFGLLEVLEARRTLATARERALDARLRLAQARVEVERLVGGSQVGPQGGA